VGVSDHVSMYQRRKKAKRGVVNIRGRGKGRR
jgi:hypothetical protein